MKKSLSNYVDYTILKPGTTRSQVRELCQTALENRYAAVCVPPCYVADAVAFFGNDPGHPAICTVVGFPHGMHITDTKLAECEACVAMGASELDLVGNAAFAKNGDWNMYQEEVLAFSKWCAEREITSKLILETSLLTRKEIARICELVQETPLNFVKTSTGFVGEGAQLEIVSYMRKLLPETYLIKASGGIRDIDTAWRFIDAGASRIGTSTAL